ncbi:hypothetical protein MW290_24685 [Aquincola tertiaricarbonis]|uniref:Uncharacterized protein n=1 Tax=Aquincola tertiaricarbonis TaxID=391953 RepID=A0ABY4S9N9_AQUTE|nr:hypothetical protein [Aquincola tertiaricarbonis]URI08777.1 hypothetical protein MW290_24685 [Aquincola tertiaricarbonis]
MPAAYPPYLPLALRASKSRTQPPAFRMVEPRRGAGYAQAVGTDTPVLWDVGFRFTRDEAIAFQLWFTQIIRRGLDEFDMPIRTEFGLLVHTCRFLDQDLLPTREDGETWGYTATIMARSQVIPEGYAEAAEIIAGLPDWRTWANLLDPAINVEMPGA